jgi:DNA (cytosine-5)-methyltransferase 1
MEVLVNASPPLTCGSLFSGVGGMDIGLQWAGFRHLFFAEIDAYCRAVLAARFPGVHIYEDVRDVARTNQWCSDLDEGLRRADESFTDPSSSEVKEPWRDHLTDGLDLLCGGFPCQDLSVAGKRAGLAGERSGLFFEFMRIVDALRPRAILIENVEGLYSSGSPKGADFGVVLDSLAERGYLASWRTLDAQHFGVPQRRRRVFVCAIADGDLGAERVGEVLAVAEGGDGDSPTSDPSWPLSAATAGRGAEGSGGRIVGALSAAAYVKYTDQEFVRQGQLVTGEDLIRTGKNAEVIKRTGDDTYYIEDVERGPVKAGGAGGGPPRSDRLPLITYRKSRRAQSAEDSESWVDDGIANTLNQFDTGDTRTTHVVAGAPTVRRLTPTECERLMGWPDGWTDIPWNKKDHAPDSRRYAACGNGVVAPVAFWIGARLAEVLRES